MLSDDLRNAVSKTKEKEKTVLELVGSREMSLPLDVKIPRLSVEPPPTRAGCTFPVDGVGFGSWQRRPLFYPTECIEKSQQHMKSSLAT